MVRPLMTTRAIDPLAIIANLGRALAVGGPEDMREAIERAWALAQLGDLPEAEGTEPIEGTDEPYSCGDILTPAIEHEHGVHGLWRDREFTVDLKWTDRWGHEFTERRVVKADSPMDAARVAYHEECDDRSEFVLGYVMATVDGERFELQPVTCVRPVRQ